MKQTAKKLFAATLLAAGVGYAAVGFADDVKLAPIDSFLKTTYEKSVISGQIRKDNNGFIHVESDASLGQVVLFDYSGKVYVPKMDGATGEIVAMGAQVGTISGTAKFPLAFAQAAIGVKAALLGVGPMPSMPATIPWSCKTCNLVVGGSTYRSVVDVNFPGAEDMKMQGRAFTGLGPVEVAQLIPGNSLSVRMAGCSALVSTDGPNKGKVGTLCLNGTFSFDLSGVLLGSGDPADMTPFTSNISGLGTSNCTTVLHNPPQM